jgi:aryl-alcohol dehydrogenase-like predicted oxidoreductase
MISERMRMELAPGYSISRIIKGGWQLAGGHGRVDRNQALDDMRRFAAAGITTFDCADIYSGVEELIGTFLRREKDAFNSGTLPQVQIHTKFVPDLDQLNHIGKDHVERIVNRSLQRLGLERLDLVQMHWWDYSIPGYQAAAGFLGDLQRAGKVRHVGVTNFDASHLQSLTAAGIPVISNQVQYSVLDRRPESELTGLCRSTGMKLLSYGAVAGGFISERWLGQNPPERLENRSLIKYRLIIEEFGGFDLFQDLLRALQAVGSRHNTGISETAIRYILDKPETAAVIVGARSSRHLSGLLNIKNLQLNPEDREEIQAVLNRAQGPSGPVYALERDREGPHGRIMKYSLNRE